MGYVLAQAVDQSVQVTVAGEPAAVHTWNDAAAESLLLKQRSPLRGKPMDIRQRRVE